MVNDNKHFCIIHFDNGEKLALSNCKIEDLNLKSDYQRIQYQDIIYLISTKAITYIEEKEGNLI